MANVVTDPRARPQLVLPDFSKPDPLVTFKLDDVALVYGTKWKQRYFKKVGDDYFPLPAQWDVNHKLWRAYFVQPNTDWWVPFYPADNMQRPTGPLCDGCHSVNYDVKNKTVKEWNVGCERCHGPGSEHAANPSKASIVNPAKLDYVRANDTCIQCHSQGQPLTNPIEGRYYDWHGPSSPNGPHAITIEAHTRHRADSAGNECIACHMPKIEQTIADINVRSNTFNFITPEMTEQYKIPNPCTSCHTDKTNAWARDALKEWPGISPWRVN